jgi:flagellar assembly protein FliH
MTTRRRGSGRRQPTKRRESVADAQTRAAEELSRVQTEVEESRRRPGRRASTPGGKWCFESGKAEVQRLVELTPYGHRQDDRKRKERRSSARLRHSSLNLVLLIARKVVKVISENQKNVRDQQRDPGPAQTQDPRGCCDPGQSRGRGADLEPIKDFMRMVENVRSITVLEDSTVNKGGCVVETDFGHIDRTDLLSARRDRGEDPGNSFDQDQGRSRPADMIWPVKSGPDT